MAHTPLTHQTAIMYRKQEEQEGKRNGRKTKGKTRGKWEEEEDGEKGGGKGNGERGWEKLTEEQKGERVIEEKETVKREMCAGKRGRVKARMGRKKRERKKD
jgi:hypothetical protein